ncbi:9536_t:CDS:2, partial [Ambispora leptoticha]
MKNKEAQWHDYIDKRVIRFSPHDKLDKVLTKLRVNNCRLAIVQEKKKLLGIITLQDVLETLVGKIRDEREILLLPNRPNHSSSSAGEALSTLLKALARPVGESE